MAGTKGRVQCRWAYKEYAGASQPFISFYGKSLSVRSVIQVFLVNRRNGVNMTRLKGVEVGGVKVASDGADSLEQLKATRLQMGVISFILQKLVCAVLKETILW